MKRTARLAMLAAVALTMVACAPRTVMTSVRAQDYVKHPQRIYVMAVADMGWGSEFTAAFRTKLQDIVRNCNATAAFEEITGLELDQRRPFDKAVAFRADSVLSIAQGGGVVDTSGRRLSIVYNTTLGDISQNRAVWRAKFTFSRGSIAIPLAERGAVFAVELTNGLKMDGILAGCAPIQLDGGRRLDASAIPKPLPDGAITPSNRYAGPGQLSQKPTLKDLEDLLPAQ